MTQLTELVRDEIETSPSVRIDLAQRIVNVRALAKLIRKKHNLSASLDAIISAIRRYDEAHQARPAVDDPRTLIVNSRLSVKNQISSVLLDKNEDVLRAIPKLFERVEMARHTVLRVVHAQRSVKIFLDQSLLPQVLPLFPEKHIKTIERELGEIIIDLNERAWRKMGILSLLTSELYLNRINILECLTCIPEIVLIVREDDLMKAYGVLYRISKGTGK